MSPEQARKRSRRSTVVAIVALVVYVPVHALKLPVDFLPAGIALLAALGSARLSGWADGYEAAELARASAREAEAPEVRP